MRSLLIQLNYKKISLLRGIIFLVAFLLLSVHLFNYTNMRMIHEDEVIYIEKGKFYEWYRHADFSRPEWRSFESYDVPKFAELFYGWSISFHYGKPTITVLRDAQFLEEGKLNAAGEWRVDAFHKECCTIDKLPNDIQQKIQPILVARKYSVVFFTLPTLVIIFLIAMRVFNYSSALIAMVLIGSNFLFHEAMTTAMIDGPLLFFSLLFVYLLFSLPSKFSKKSLSIVVILGIVAGLATATKLNGAILLVIFEALLFWKYFIDRDLQLITVAIYTCLVIGIAYFVFFILNPFIWSNPLVHSVFMIDHKLGQFQLFESIMSEASLPHYNQRFYYPYVRTLDSAAIYGNFVANKWNGALRLPVDTVVFIIGVALIIKGKMTNSKLIFLIWSVLTWFLTSLFLPMDWDRYYLPYILIIGFVQGYALSQFFTVMSHNVAKNQDLT